MKLVIFALILAIAGCSTAAKAPDYVCLPSMANMTDGTRQSALFCTEFKGTIKTPTQPAATKGEPA